MARGKQDRNYLLEEPNTGLYIALGAERASLTTAPAATRFSTAREAVLGAQQIHDQPHELVRLDA